MQRQDRFWTRRVISRARKAVDVSGFEVDKDLIFLPGKGERATHFEKENFFPEEWGDVVNF